MEKLKGKAKLIAVIVGFIFLAGCVVPAITYPFWGRTSPPDFADNGDQNPAPDPDPNPGEDADPDTDPDKTDPEPDPNLIPRPEYVRGLYLSGNGAGHAPLRDPILQLLRESELNALVIDIKRDDGHITYRDTQVQWAIESGANANFVNMREFMEVLRDEQIYPIARMVVAKDKFVSQIRPDLFLQSTSGGVWRGRGDMPWADMRNREYWDYLIELSIEAAEMGFREIQFDYVRFPSGGDGTMSTIATQIPKSNLTPEGPYERSEIVAEFLAYAIEKLEPYNVEVSADTFGIMGTVKDEQSVGQQLEIILDSGIDVISPMIYPGHYWPGTYGQANPNRAPFEVVYQSTKDHLVRMEAMGSKTVMRPWLQDFTDWSDQNFPYGVNEIHAQLRALDELGVKEYLFWNANNRYTHEAYKTWQWSE